ncbi:MAG: Ig-like domain-containing protein, partial [Bacteroidota bacterium]
MRLFQLHRRWFGLLPAVLVLSCAGQAPPSGGPEDMEPPQIISVYPAPYTTLYNDSKIVLEFDEYVDRNSVNQSIFISPFLGGLEFDWSGKEVEISFKEKLKDSTTYVVNVGTDVKDVRRGNRMAQAFTLAFSTGASIDRGGISGTVYPRSPGQPVSGVMMFAYKLSGMDPDTLNPKSASPDYITQTGDGGEFFLNHLSFGPYRVFAVRDEYRNLVYDPETDEFGIPSRSILLTEGDTLVSDLTIRLAKEDTSAPRLIDAIALHEGLVLAEFSEWIDTLQLSRSAFQIVDTLNQTRLNVLGAFPRLPDCRAVYVLTDKQTDERGYALFVGGLKDSVGLEISTLANSLPFSGLGVADTTQPMVSGLTFRDSTRNAPLDQAMMIYLNEPVQAVDWMQVVQFQDSLRRNVPVEGRWAGASGIELRPVNQLAGLMWHSVRINTGLVKDFAGNAGKDTVLVFSFETLDSDRLSGIEGVVVEVHPDDAMGPVVIKALDVAKKAVIVQTLTIPGPGNFSFGSLLEGQYTLEAYKDRNGNGSYDAGNVFPFQISERFTMYSDTLRLRARWPVEGV